jgi:hypothetical protein
LLGCNRLINSQTAQMVNIRPAAKDKYKMVQARLQNCSERRQKVTIEARTAILSSGGFIIM